VATLLTEGYDAEKEAEQLRREKAAIDVADVLIKMWLDAYAAGDSTFEGFCERVRRMLSGPAHDNHRLIKLGQAVDVALNLQPKKRNRGSARSRVRGLVEVCHDLVEKASKEEGLPKVRTSKKAGLTAFERVAGILQSHGVTITSVTVEKHWSWWNKRGDTP
jgi:hypothetical protein